MSLPGTGCLCHQWDTHGPWRAGSPRGVSGPPEQPEPPCWMPAGAGAGAWQGVRTGGAGPWHGSSISHDDPSHRTAPSTDKMDSGEQHAECQGPHTGPGCRAGASWGCCACRPPPNPLTTTSALPPQPFQHGSLCTWALNSIPRPPEAPPAKGWGRGTPRAPLQHGTESAVPRGRAEPRLCPRRGFLAAVCSRQSMPAAPAPARRSAWGRVTLTQLAAPAAPRLPRLLQKRGHEGRRLGIGSREECVSTTGTGTGGNQGVPRLGRGRARACGARQRRAARQSTRAG